MSETSLFPPVLCLGAKGKAVAALQIILMGAKADPWQGLQVDGDYGDITVRSAQYLQARLNFTGPEKCTGVVYDGFLRTMCQNAHCEGSALDITSEWFTREPTMFTGPGFEDQPRRFGRTRSQIGRAFPRWLNMGSEGRAVALLQLFLLGADRARNIRFDGVYGSETAARVATLQRSLNVDPDGNFGPQTRQAVAAEYGIDFDTLLMAPFRVNTQWHESACQPLQFHPRRGRHYRAVAERSRLTMANQVTDSAPPDLSRS